VEHLSTFGLSRDPFANEPRIDDVFTPPSFGDVERRLQRAAIQGKGLVLVTGAGGVGKSVLARHWLEGLEEELFEACMLVPIPGVIDGPRLLSRLAVQLGVEEPTGSAAELLALVYEQLAIVHEDGRKGVVIVDEAQVLADAGLLPMLRGLLNLEYEEHRLLTLVLVGLPCLAQAVRGESALADRIDMRLSLPALDAAQARDYLTHRIRGADGNPAILESAAVEALVKESSGIPRRLNNLADSSLFEAHLAGRVSATPADVERAVAELWPAGAEPGSGATTGTGSSSQDSAAREAPRGDSVSEVALELELDEVVAAPTVPPVRPAEPMAGMLSDAPDPAKAMLVDAPPTNPLDAGQTIALMPEPNADGELDDLFADLLDD